MTVPCPLLSEDDLELVPQGAHADPDQLRGLRYTWVKVRGVAFVRVQAVVGAGEFLGEFVIIINVWGKNMYVCRWAGEVQVAQPPVQDQCGHYRGEEMQCSPLSQLFSSTIKCAGWKRDVQ